MKAVELANNRHKDENGEGSFVFNINMKVADMQIC